MPEPVSITTAHESVEVDLWGAVFHTRRVTRSVSKALDALQREISDRAASGEDADADDLMATYANMLDVLLEPEDGKRKKASAHITERWEADQLALGEVEDFIGRLAEASRPT